MILERLSIDQCDGCGKVGGRLFAQEMKLGQGEGGSMFQDRGWTFLKSFNAFLVILSNSCLLKQPAMLASGARI